MSAPPYVPLRIHSLYSIAEGAIFPGPLAERLAAWRAPAAAIADTESISGIYTTTAALTKAGIQPLTAVQAAVSHPAAQRGAIETSSLTLIARTAAGYATLCRLLSRSQTERTPVDLREILSADVNRHLLVLTGGARGPVDKALAASDPERAHQRLKTLHAALGDRLYCEIQRQTGAKATDTRLLAIAHELSVSCAATSECWFLDAESAEANDVLLCISDGVTLNHETRRRADPNGYLKSPEEMATLFQDAPNAVANTVEIAKRCDFLARETDPILPAFPTSGRRSEDAELRRQSESGLEARLQQIGLTDTESRNHGYARQDYLDRLDHELTVISGMGFPGYFLIVADFIAWAKKQGIPVGPGRGSGAGSLVAWALTITDLDPLRYGLFFERFLNPERVSMPDFDIDFCQERRDEVIAYVRAKYGSEHVAQIGTLGKLQARAVIRDVGRVMQVPFPVVDRYCKLIPNNPANPVGLADAMETEPLAPELAGADETIQQVFATGKRLEGLYRHQSTHAAGVVIGNRPVSETVPIYRDAHDALVTAFDMKSVEKAGLVKFDFLGLKTLDIIEGARAISRRAGDPVHMDPNDTDDPETYAMLRRGDSFGVFQLESAGMRKAMLQIQPTRIEDIIALVSLYRPGPMENIPTYAAVKSGAQAPHYLHPHMEATLAETHGIIVYQEQVMKLAQDLAGYTLGGADMLRRAMGKKIKSEMDAQRDIFLQGATEKGIDTATAENIFDLIARFANYGFNKSHAAAYAVIAFQTAYLRCHHREAFLAATMNLDINDVEKIAESLENARRHDVDCLRPDINASAACFDIEKNADRPAVRHGLAALRGVGTSMAGAVVEERERNGKFASLSDFVARTKANINKKLVESLIAAGAMDSLHENRRAMTEALPDLLASAAARANDASRGQATMFDLMPAGPAAPLPSLPDWPAHERLQRQYKTVGFYLDSHPIELIRETLDRSPRSRRIADILDAPEAMPKDVSIGAVITESIFKRTAKKDPLLILKVSDETGLTEVIAFREAADHVRDRLARIDGTAARFEVSVSMRNDEVSLFLRDIEPLDPELF